MKNVVHKLRIVLLVLVLLASGTISGCSGKTKTEPAHFSDKSAPEGKRIFVDSLGRELEIPKEVKRIVPSGRLAQLFLTMTCPEKLVSLANLPLVWDPVAKDLPLTGQLYGGSGQFNREEVLKISPDVIIDLGEAKETIRDDMEKIQSVTGVPTIFIEANITQTANAFRLLGQLFGNEAHCEELATYTEEAIRFAQDKAKTLSKEQKTRVYQTSTADGLGADLNGTAHAEVLNLVGAVNAADVDAVGGRPGQRVSMEEILNWNPQVIVCTNATGYATVRKQSLWKEVDAVKNNRVYLAPSVPYNVLSSPPSANRVIGIYWLGKTVYPELYQEINLEQKIREWYHLAYHHDLTEEEMEKYFPDVRGK